MSKSKELDQFYTKVEIAKYCSDRLEEYYPFSTFDNIVEPATGTGAFYNLMPVEKRVGLDIDPKIEVRRLDYLKEYNHNISGSTLVLTNPPYGTNSTLAVKFFKKSSEFADVIGFLVPIQWKRYSLQNRLPKEWNLIYSEDLPKDSFIFEGESYGVSTCFQIWDKSSTYTSIRKQEKPITSHPDFSFVKNPLEADFLLVVCGRRKQYIHEIDSTISRFTVERIKCNKEGVREVFEKIDWDKYGEQSTGTMWINREMIVSEYLQNIP